jgi:hypothetical protein
LERQKPGKDGFGKTAGKLKTDNGYITIHAVSYTVSACGEFRISYSMKQELNIKSDQ